MASLWAYIKDKWNRRFATKAEERFPVKNDIQKKYRKEFGDIVDQYLISYSSERDENPKGYHHIVYIDADDNLYWIVDGEKKKKGKAKEVENRSEDTAVAGDPTQDARYSEYMSRLRNLLYAPVSNLSRKEKIAFRMLVGSGCKAALSGSWAEVEQAIASAEQYRAERNREFSRFILLTAATVYMALLTILYFVYTSVAGNRDGDIPHFHLVTTMALGALGAYVSIWMRYGKMDMTGLGTRKMHYLEAGARMLMGVIFAMIIFFALKSGILANEWVANEETARYIYALLGFCAGFSEKFVPSILEKFMGKGELSPAHQKDANNGQNNNERTVN